MLETPGTVTGALLPIPALIVARGNGVGASSNRCEPRTGSEAGGGQSNYAAMARVACVDSLESARALQQASDALIANTSETSFLQDGRARTILEAIVWHGGEAEAAGAANE